MLFNFFFANQCSLIKNTSELPTNYENVTDKFLFSITFTDNDIGKIIKGLDPNKAHGHDMISIPKLKLCRGSMYKPLRHIFRARDFSLMLEKANVAPIHNKNGKQSIKNYRPVFLLPTCGKVLERLLYNKMYFFFIEYDLISQIKSGFKPGDSCINQLLSITHKIYKSFDDSWEVRGFFLDISKAFDKV